MVIFKNVTKTFGRHAVISDMNLEISRGQLAVLIGPSGCGKTTTLKLINRLQDLTGGSIFVDGKDISETNPVELRRSIGYVIQQIGLFPNMTIEQNIEVVPRLLKYPKEKCHERTRELLDMVGMEPSKYLGRYPFELSGGQQQRIGVLRALATSPPLMLMDEPFGALDPITRDSLQDEIKKLQKSLGITIVFVTHDMDEAIKLADVIILMKDGKIVQKAPPEELLANPANGFVREFTGKKRIKANYDLDLVHEIMNPSVVVVTKEKGFAGSLDLMRKRNVDSLVVIDDAGHLEGVITVEALLGAAKRKRIGTIGEVELLKVPTIDQYAQARDAFSTIIEKKLPFLLVVDNNNRLKGIVTKTSVVKALASIVWKDENNE